MPRPAAHSFAHARKEYVSVNEVRHGVVTVPAHDPRAPLLLIAHGGPGAPLIPLLSAKGFDLRELATVCLWDQRGAGMSTRGVDYDSLTLEVLIDDTARLAEHLLATHRRDRAVLMGHSWGAYLGAVTAARHAKLFAGFVGVGQPNRLADGERTKWHYFRQQASLRGDTRTVAVLDAMANKELSTHQPWAKVQARENRRTGTGMLRRGYGQGETLTDVFRCRQYSLRERLAVLPGIFHSHRLFEEVAQDALTELAPTIDVPVHVFAGAHDYMTPSSRAREFYDAVDAPHKTWTEFAESAHSPFIDESERFRDAIATVIAGCAA